MKIDDMAEHIRKLYSVISGLLGMTYPLPTGVLGMGKPNHGWFASMLGESSDVSLEKAAGDLLEMLKAELKNKAVNTEAQAQSYRRALSSLEN